MLLDEVRQQQFPTIDDISRERDRRSAETQAGSWEAENDRCSRDILHWFDRWVWTYDPRIQGTRNPDGTTASGFLRMKLWPKQREVVLQICDLIDRNREGLLEKSRDVGATFLCAGIALHRWRYREGFKATFGSRITDLVDKKGNPDAIFTKLRIIRDRLPRELMPPGFSIPHHDNYMRMLNPDNGATITGEGGEEMGRGGRSKVYFMDEAAFVPHAATVEKALSGNTDCVIWVSSANGQGNLFARKRHSILKPDQIMRIHWRDDPRKTEEWAREKEASFSDPTTWASEYDIDYSASVEGICIPALWVESAKRLARLDKRVRASFRTVLGGDVGAGKAKSIIAPRRGAVFLPPRSRREPDTTDTAYWMLDIAEELGADVLNFDAVGVGAGVSSTLMKAVTADNESIEGLQVAPVNTGDAPDEERVWPDNKTSAEKFGNLKAEIWWLARTAFQRTHEHVLFLEGKKGGKEHPVTDLVALPSVDQESDALNFQLSLVKWGRNEKGKIVIETKKALATRGIQSPDYAEAFVLCFFDPPLLYDATMAWVGKPPKKG